MTVAAHRLPLRHWLAIFWFLPVFALRAQFPPDIVRIAAANAPAAIWTTPNSQAQLQVTITDTSGQPVSGQSVVFVAPADGPSGALSAPASAAAGSAVFRTTSLADGTATAVLTTNSQIGPFLVSAWVERTQQAVHMAVSNVAANPRPGLDPATAVAALSQQLQPPDGSTVYGPFLLDAGSAVISATPVASDAEPTLVLDRPTVFFWIDDNPQAAFNHPVRYVVLDANDPAPSLSAPGAVVKRLWFPVIAPPGAGTQGLVPPLFLIPEGALVAATQTPAAAAPASRLRFGPVADTPNSDVCAVVVYGPDSAAFKVSAANMHGVFHDILMIPESNIIEDIVPGTTDTRASSKSGIHDVLNKIPPNCKKIYFYFAGHGNSSGVCVEKHPIFDSFSKSPYAQYDFHELALDLEGSGVREIDVILSSCQSGAAIKEMQGHRFKGTIATAADPDSLAKYSALPGFRGYWWSDALAETWRDLYSLGPQQDISLGNVALAVGEGRDPALSPVMSGNPLVAAIDPAAAVVAPDVTMVNIDDPAQNSTTITVTPPPGLAKGDIIVSVLIDDLSIAIGADNLAAGNTLEHNQKVTLKNGAGAATFKIQGLKPGKTTYKLSCQDKNGSVFSGTGNITVGAGYSVSPNPVGLHKGASAAVKIARGTELQKQPGPVQMTIQPADADSAGVATPSSGQVTFQPGSTEQTFEIKAVKAGTATFKITDGKSSTTLQVLVDSVSLNPTQLQMKVGEQAFVMLVREGPVLPTASNSLVTVTQAFSPVTVATVTPTNFLISTTVRQFTLLVNAVSPGTTNFTIASPTEGFSFPLSVTVSGPIVIGSCPVSLTLDGSFTVVIDLFDSSRFVGLTSGSLGMTRSGNTVTLKGDRDQLPTATGAIDPNTCTFTLDATATRPIAGFSNVKVQYKNWVIGPTSFTGTYLVGLDNTLNNEPQPVTYSVKGMVK